MSANKMSKHAGKACAIAASALLAASSLTAMLPSQAFAIDETRTFTWANGSPQPDIPQTITGADGREYKLTSQTQPQQQNAGQTQTQQFSKNESRTISPDQLNQVASIMPASVAVNEGGFSGNIPRVSIDTTPVYRSEDNKITSTADAYGDTAEAAKAALPQSIQRNGRTLTLTDSKVEEARKDTAGNVILYKAIGTYSVDSPRQVLDHYDVVARYSGTLSRTVNGGDWSIQATYTAEDAPAEEQPQEPEQPAEQPAEPVNENTSDNEINMLPPQDMNGNAIDESTLDDGYDDYDAGEQEPEQSVEETQDESGIPIIPIAIGAGVVVLGGVVAGVLISRKKKKAAASDSDFGGVTGAAGLGAGAAAMSVGGGDMLASMDFGEEGAFDATVAGPVIIEDPQCQLIELITIEVEDEDGNIGYEYEQKPKADLEIEPSCVPEVPTVVYFPALEDAEGNPIDFVPTEGAQYWIAIDEETVQSVPNKDIIIASDDDKEIYRGSLIEFDGELTEQLQLDTDYMTSVVNGTADEDDVIDISTELEAYEEIVEDALASAPRSVPSAETFQLDDDDDFELDEMDVSMFDDEESFGDDFASSLDSFSDEQDYFDDGVEYASDDTIGDMFADASSRPVDPFAAYGIAEDEPYGTDNFDSDFEREMDDFEYDADLEPDVDEFDFEEDFQPGTVIEPETEIVDDMELGYDLDDMEFDDIVDIDDVEVIADESVGKKKDIQDFQDLLNSI